MDKIVLVLVWPVGLAVILAAGALLARRAPATASAKPAPPSAPGRPAAALRQPESAPGVWPAVRAVLPSVARLLLAVLGGAIVVYGVMVLLGLLVVHAGPAIDKPTFNWIAAHRIHLWTSAMTRATRVADTWTARGAAVTAAVCLAVAWHRTRWLPPVALGLLILLQRPLTSAIHHTIHRLGPPGHPHGTFPSGGCERAIVFYGLIAYLLWREFSGTRRAAIWAGTVVALLAFNEGYSRLYLGMHWLTDTVSGWIYGSLLLIVFIAGIRFALGESRPAMRAVRRLSSGPRPQVTTPSPDAPQPRRN